MAGKRREPVMGPGRPSRNLGVFPPSVCSLVSYTHRVTVCSLVSCTHRVTGSPLCQSFSPSQISKQLSPRVVTHPLTSVA